MDREEAIAYLERKGTLNNKIRKEFEKNEGNSEFTEKDVKEVMKKGKIYGDPCVELG